MRSGAIVGKFEPAPFIIKRALESLADARDLLKAAGATRATDKTRRALKSAEGALRHAYGREARR